MRLLVRYSLSLMLCLLWPLMPGASLAADLFNWNEPGASGTTWPGYTYMGNVDGYGNPGFRKNGAVDIGGDDWRPRGPYQKSDCGTDGWAMTIDPNKRAPSSSTGGSLKVTKKGSYVCAWGMLADDVFYYKGWTDASTNRMSWYVWYEGAPDNGLTSNDPSDYGDNLGTYIFPDHKLLAGNEVAHYYHWSVPVNGLWIHIQMDTHPQHERGVSNTAPANNPKAPTYLYYRNVPTFYWDWQATTVWIDEVKFWTQTQPENDISIASVWVGYRAPDGHWLLSFYDSSWGSNYGDQSVGTYEVRWSSAPITNANWAAAIPITPLYNAATGPGSGPGRIRRPNPWKQIAYTQFSLPAGTVAANSRLYFAIKDVSSTSYGDGHNSPSSNVKTIDYALPTGDASRLPPPTNLRVLH